MSFNKSHILYHRLTVDRVQTSSSITILKAIPILLLIFINFYLHYLRIHDFHRPLLKQNTYSKHVAKLNLLQFENKFEHNIVRPFKKHLNKLEDTITLIKPPSKLPKPFSQILNSLPVKSTELNQSEVDHLAEHESNLPIIYYHQWKSLPAHNQKYLPLSYCNKVQLPDPLNLKQNNLYWQVLSAKNQKQNKVNMWLLNAYYDKRMTESPAVKIVASVDAYREKIKWWCLLWFSNHKSPLLVKSTEYFAIMSEAPGAYHTVLITCPIPSLHHTDIPKAVSLQAYGHCDDVEQEPSNVLRIIFRHNRKSSSKNSTSIGICVKSLKLKTYDVSVRLVEWLEMVRIFGAEKIYFYVYGVTDNLHKILEHYSAEGFVEWRPLTLPGSQPNVPSLFNLYAFNQGQLFWPQELVELNDCFYRNMYQHEYLLVKDIDEIVVPQRANSWQEMLRDVESNMPSFQVHTTSFYAARHAHVCEVFTENQYFDHHPIPEYLYIMRHTSRSQLFSTSQNIKSFLKTSLVTAVHNHRPLRCIIPGKRKKYKYSYCQGVPLDEEYAVLMHYRRNQSASTHVYRNDDCKVRDRSAWRWRWITQKRVRDKLKQIFG